MAAAPLNIELANDIFAMVTGVAKESKRAATPKGLIRKFGCDFNRMLQFHCNVRSLS